MFEELSQYLGWTNRFPENDSFLVIAEGTDCGFILQHFIHAFLKRKLPVCLVSTSQTFSHYAQAGIKIGANLDKAREERSIRLVDLMSKFLNHYTGQSECDWNAKNIYLSIKEELDSLEISANSLLIIDDISVLSSLSMSTDDVGNFLHYLRTLSKQRGFNLLVSIPSLDCEQVQATQSVAEHYADTVLCVKSLQTGYSKEVHGQLEVVKGGSSNCGVRQYKLSDKNLHLFARGTSMAVL